MSDRDAFLEARAFLQAHRLDYETAYREFSWPDLKVFNWATDYFDPYADGNHRLALLVADESGGEVRRSFDQMRRRSNQVANLLRRLGVSRRDRILVMLDNVVPLWEVMLAAIKLGAVIIPASTLLTVGDLKDRLSRGQVSLVVTDGTNAAKFAALPGSWGRLVVGDEIDGWVPFTQSETESETFEVLGETRADDPLFLYFTSGTTALPKLVLHTHQSYPVGHLSTMYWIGLQEGDLHWNISSPGWAKHAWSSFFAPWTAGAAIFMYNYARFSARGVLDVLDRYRPSTLCAPPTVWRMLIGEDLRAFPQHLREAVSAGEPMNPEVIAQVQRAWGLTLRDGYGQTETTAQIANPPGQPLKAGAMGRPLPGYRVALLDDEGTEAAEGELSLLLSPRPLGLMAGYQDDPERTAEAFRSGAYRTGDVASRDQDGYYWYVGRADDVFKAADYRISPFELESVLIEHPAVAEAAVVPSPDPLRTNVPKAFVVLRPGHEPGPETALSILQFVRAKVSPFKRIRRLEFADLPKTISSKIRRVELREAEARRRQTGVRSELEYDEQDFPELR